jgi:LmbE family N-acetylglucosaminyl deacetylase
MWSWPDQRVLIIAPHLDDEVLGCGGLISVAKRAGAEVFVLFGAVGGTVEFSSAGESTAGERKCELVNVARHLGLDGYEILFDRVALDGQDYQGRLDTLPQVDLIRAIEWEGPLSINQLRPSLVLLPDLTSYHQDHRALGQAAMSALRPASPALKHQPAGVLAYEIVADGWTAAAQRVPDVFFELSERDLTTKIDAMRLYTSQVREQPNPRHHGLLRNLAEIRGAQCGARLAEAYHCLRWRVS